MADGVPGVPDAAAGGARRPTLEDVAARAGLSRSTVSLVIRQAPGPSAATRERVMRAATELGYRPDATAQLLRRQRRRLLGVVCSLRDPFHADLLDGVYPAAEELGYDVVVSAHGATRTEAASIEVLLGFRCEAVILFGPAPGAEHVAQLGRQLPVVAIGTHADGAPIDTLRTADDEGVRQAVEHLVELGHRRIVHIDGGTRAGADDRRRGYLDAMRRHGLASEARILPGDATEVSGARCAETLVGEGDLPTAVLAFNDRCATGVLDVLRIHGIDVPGRVSVVGYDDSQLSRLAHIDLTTVRQDADRLARLAVQAAASRLDHGRRHPREQLLGPQLMPRGTTARAHA